MVSVRGQVNSITPPRSETMSPSVECALSATPSARRTGLAAAVSISIAAALIFAGDASATQTTGFAQPFSGNPKYLKWAPTQATKPAQFNQPLGSKAAERIARAIGLDRRHVFTSKQYKLFVSGKGNGGDPASAKIVDESVRILTNTRGRPLISNVNGVITRTVLASYGLMVNTKGLLQSLANSTSPAREVNSIIAPGGYLGKWCRSNGAGKSLSMLYRSAYTSEAVFGNKAQVQSGTAQLVPNLKGSVSSTVGMSIAPAIWIVNFALIYNLNPAKAAALPAYWVPIPANVVSAINASPSGQVPYSDYASSLAGL